MTSTTDRCTACDSSSLRAPQKSSATGKGIRQPHGRGYPLDDRGAVGIIGKEIAAILACADSEESSPADPPAARG